MKTDKKRYIAGLLTAAVVAGSAAGYLMTHKNMDGASPEEIAAYRALHPDKIITYTVTIDGGSSPLKIKHNTTDISLESEAQLPALIDSAAYLQHLQTIAIPAIDGEDLLALCKAFPNADVRFDRITVLGSDYAADTRIIAFSRLTDEAARTAADVLSGMPALQSVTMHAANGSFTAETAAYIAAALPDTEVILSFDLFGQTVSSDAERIEYFKTEIGDEGLDTIRAVMPIMDKLTYLKLDWCGTSDEATAALRDELSDRCKVVWRVFLTDEFNALTDTYKIWAQFNLYGDDVECLKYCTEVRYIDMGHSYVDNCEFVKYMPHLNTLILADSRLEDLEPLRTCKNLTYLEVFSSKVKDLSPLADLPQLEYLNISNCKFDDISPLYGLDNLYILNCTMAHISADQIAKFKELHPDTKCTFNWYKSPTEFCWRYGPTPNGYQRTPRYALLREQIGYDTKDYSRYPTGYLTHEVTYESTGILPPEQRDYEVYPK